jgi:hypothetical protein
VNTPPETADRSVAAALGRRVAFRKRILRKHGARDAVLAEVLSYTAPVYARPDSAALAGLERDEPHVSVWHEYSQEAHARGAVETLRVRFPQLRFPVSAGLSRTEPYRRATLRGEFEAAAPFAPGLVLECPERVRLDIVTTLGGRIPVLTVGARRDFEALVCALTARNEPIVVPPSMGACLVSGLINWDRVARHRQAWCRDTTNEAAWPQEFERMSRHRDLYQDRLIILSSGSYSAVSADRMGLTAEQWADRSLAIRREHEGMHYLTCRLFGRIRQHPLDEVLADFVGLLAAFGRYEAHDALAFLGLQAFPAIDPRGRLVNYTTSVISDAATSVVAELIVLVARRLESLTRQRRLETEDRCALARTVGVLVSCSLEELAAADGVLLTDRMEAR